MHLSFKTQIEGYNLYNKQTFIQIEKISQQIMDGLN